MNKNPCKRMIVTAIGRAYEGDTTYCATNYNLGECTQEVGNCGCVHAEAALLEILPNPSYVFVSHSPCLNCAQKLVRAGVKKVVYAVPYRKLEGIDYLRWYGVEVMQGLALRFFTRLAI